MLTFSISLPENLQYLNEYSVYGWWLAHEPSGPFSPGFLSGFLSEIFSLKYPSALNQSEAGFKEVFTTSFSR